MTQRYVIKKKKDEAEVGHQVYSDQFMDYDYAWNLVDWLNKHNGESFIYYLEEVSN